VCAAVCDDVELAQCGGGGVHARNVTGCTSTTAATVQDARCRCVRRDFQVQGLQSSFGDDQAVRVVVYMSEADSVGALSKYAQAPGASSFENVRQEEVISRAVPAEMQHKRLIVIVIVIV
jgi:hypothetical protein